MLDSLRIGTSHGGNIVDGHGLLKLTIWMDRCSNLVNNILAFILNKLVRSSNCEDDNKLVSWETSQRDIKGIWAETLNSQDNLSTWIFFPSRTELFTLKRTCQEAMCAVLHNQAQKHWITQLLDWKGACGLLRKGSLCCSCAWAEGETWFHLMEGKSKHTYTAP